MIDKQKIVVMTKLAIMEKNNIQQDLKDTSYYEEDYVYINNLKTRISILILVGVGMAAHLLWRIESGLNIPLSVDEIVREYILPYGIVFVLALIIYTVISSLVYKARYKEAARRVETYKEQLQQLREIQDNKI